MKRCEAEKTVIQDSQDFLSWEKVEMNGHGGESASQGDDFFLPLEEKRNTSAPNWMGECGG